MQVAGAPAVFTELSDFVKAFIAEKDAKEGNLPSSAVQAANQLLIAISNAENIFRDCTLEQKPILDAKKGEFREMLACLPKADYGKLNLPDLIRFSIDSGTKDGWIPKVYAVNPQHIVPKKEFILRIFGKFKYADSGRYKPTLTFGKSSFEPIEADHHSLKFRVTLSSEEGPFKSDKCAQFFGRLVVPYEAGTLIRR